MSHVSWRNARGEESEHLIEFQADHRGFEGTPKQHLTFSMSNDDDDDTYSIEFVKGPENRDAERGASTGDGLDEEHDLSGGKRGRKSVSLVALENLAAGEALTLGEAATMAGCSASTIRSRWDEQGTGAGFLVVKRKNVNYVVGTGNGKMTG